MGRIVDIGADTITVEPFNSKQVRASPYEMMVVGVSYIEFADPDMSTLSQCSEVHLRAVALRKCHDAQKSTVTLGGI